jgi:hypothetical protein
MVAALVVMAACGGRTANPATSTSDGGGGGDANDTGVETGGDDADSPNPACVSPSGYALCGGPNGCFPPSGRGQGTACWSCNPDYGYDMVLCANAVVPIGPGAGVATPGQVYVEGLAPDAWEPVPFDVGQLFASNGAVDRVRYADWSAWTGAALPNPSSCPAFSAFSTCGGSCAPCSTGLTCTGLSPTHAYGVCVDASTPQEFCDTQQGWVCPSGDACVVFQDDAQDQPFADHAGFCFPAATCQAIASEYPGGANCHTG